MNQEGFRDTLYTVDKSGRRKWVYVQHLKGWFGRRRALVAYVLMALYLLMPWVTINGKQGILLNLSARRFVFFGVEFWATDTVYLALFLGSLGLALFFFTALLGRVWCGWACPETVFLEFLFRPIERLIEGNAAERRRLDAAPWTIHKGLKKLTKHGFCALAAWVLASTCLAYFIGREPLLAMMLESPAAHPIPFALTAALMGVMAFQFGWFREQFCTVLCPYARFQSVLMDQDSLIVGYDSTRGEPRGKLRQASSTPGDCIDCGLCVRVCPTGIDIRNGTQLECIACTNCIDACDSVMSQIGRSPGLVRYDSERVFQGGKKIWLRPRVIVYGFILSAFISALAITLASREALDLDIVRTRTESSFSVDAQNFVSNQFSIRLSNKYTRPLQIDLRVFDAAGSSVVDAITPLPQLTLIPGRSEQVPLFLKAPLNGFRSGRLNVRLEFSIPGHKLIVKHLTILGPS